MLIFFRSFFILILAERTLWKSIGIRSTKSVPTKITALKTSIYLRNSITEQSYYKQNSVNTGNQKGKKKELTEQSFFFFFKLQNLVRIWTFSDAKIAFSWKFISNLNTSGLNVTS